MPPIGTHPVWEVRWHAHNGSASGTDFFTYGAVHLRCGNMYVTVMRNGTEEVLYLRMTEDKAYYLLDLDNCEERLLYDYSFTEPIEIPLLLYGGFSPATVALSETLFQPDSTEVRIVNLAYSSFGSPTFNVPGYWFRGIGNFTHPFYPLYNAYDPLSAVDYFVRSMTLDYRLLYCGGNAPCEPQQIIYVDKDVVGGAADGSSWANAFPNVEGALSSATAGDMVWVAEGVYTLPADSPRYESFVLRNGVAIYGGFAGDEDWLFERDIAAHPVTLSGDIGEVGNADDNTFHVVRVQNISSYCVLDGIRIEGGNALGGGIAFPYTEDGGGIFVYGNQSLLDTISIILKDCTIADNNALNGGGMAFDGAFASPTRFCMYNTTFSTNTASRRGGGIYLPRVQVPFLIQGQSATFTDNFVSMGGGGAITDYNDLSDWQIIHSSFRNNRVMNGEGGAIDIMYEGTQKDISLIGSVFSENRCSADGGAIGIIHFGLPGGLDMRMAQCDFIANRAASAAGGGVAIASFDPLDFNLDIQTCRFIDNRSADRGGALMIKSDGLPRERGLINISSSVFSGNNSFSNIGGAVYTYLATPNDAVFTPKRYTIKIDNTQFDNNKGAIGHGSLTNEVGSVTTFTNCTFYNNGLLPISKGYNENFDDTLFMIRYQLHNCIIQEPNLPLWQILYNGDPDNINLYEYELNHCLISTAQCDLPGGEVACYTYPNFFAANPMFRDSANTDFRLLPCSPFVNAGQSFPDLSPYDLGGDDRIQNGQIDLGAYETALFSARIDTVSALLDCFGDMTGVAEIRLDNMQLPTLFTLYNTVGNRVQTTEDGKFEYLSAGDYLVAATDAVGCADTVRFQIAQPDPLALFVSTVDYTPQNQGGQITIDSILGGTSPYQLYSDGIFIQDNVLEDLPPAIYPIRVEDGLGCVLDTLIHIQLINKADDLAVNRPQFSIFPNPSRPGQPTTISVENITSSSESYVLQVIGSQGEVLATYRLPASAGSITIPAPEAAGLYFLALLKQGAGIAKKWVVQ